ncbi:hypothetical protein DFA_02708 [Cavenderia fasciculata]|uniref:Uncharacterized protein n=1 Tax=Cavenderia fasciculata TaxID=261658 RepID=F4Q054_CACFS|nr:uncharacterized protein DFA_02708 [Cavenderia fasciculata]EGG18968.1 hypothetical protein DFA_02708 [Cavenderia fasciculata]|eukprot:XP_004357430.1 hypothetical protein DFA_02708 [Cavenderia fasciculata]
MTGVNTVIEALETETLEQVIVKLNAALNSTYQVSQFDCSLPTSAWVKIDLATPVSSIQLGEESTLRYMLRV